MVSAAFWHFNRQYICSQNAGHIVYRADRHIPQYCSPALGYAEQKLPEKAFIDNADHLWAVES